MRRPKSSCLYRLVINWACEHLEIVGSNGINLDYAAEDYDSDLECSLEVLSQLGLVARTEIAETTTRFELNDRGRWVAEVCEDGWAHVHFDMPFDAKVLDLLRRSDRESRLSTTAEQDESGGQA